VTYLIDKLHRAGAQSHLGLLVPSLDREGFEPEVVCLLAGGPVAEELRAGVPVVVLGLGLYAPRAIAGLCAWPAASGPGAWTSSTPTSWRQHLRNARRPAGRVGAVVTSRRDTGFSRNWRLRLVEEWLVNPRADRVVANTPAVAEAALGERGLTREQVVVIPNGVDLARFDPSLYHRDEARAWAAREWGLAGDEAVVGAIGSLTPVKGHADLLEAAARVVARRSRTRFVLVGDGPLRPALEAQVRRLGLRGHVRFAGAREDVPRVLASFDVVALPSHTEGLSNVLLESMAMARPIVATAVGGNPDVLRDGASGRIVPVRDPEALAAGLLGLIDDRGAAQAMGREARREAGLRFSRQRMVEGYEALYRGLPRRAGASA
jgi:glycosyltransferase involved in cell wall biosynthesis